MRKKIISYVGKWKKKKKSRLTSHRDEIMWNSSPTHLGKVQSASGKKKELFSRIKLGKGRLKKLSDFSHGWRETRHTHEHFPYFTSDDNEGGPTKLTFLAAPCVYV